jgi:hypothetical protein
LVENHEYACVYCQHAVKTARRLFWWLDMRRRVSGGSLVGDGLAQALDAALGEGNAEPQIRERRVTEWVVPCRLLSTRRTTGIGAT